MPLSRTFEVWFSSFLHLFFPRQCAVCGAALQEGEEGLCLRCNMDMPRTNYHLRTDNPVERIFWGRFPLERATSYFFYHKGSDYRRLLHLLKYGDRRDLGETLGRMMVTELVPSGFFEGIDYLVPIPLHPRKQQSRGYNQSECIARGICAVTGIATDTSAVVRQKHTDTQTRKSAYERWENVDGIFLVPHPERFSGKHVLLLDDVLTTGATITACADAFRATTDLRISVLTLAMAGS